MDFWQTIRDLVKPFSSKMVSKEVLEKDISDSGLRDSELLLTLLKETICLREESGNVNVGQSKLGGMPDMADGASYPYDKDGKPYIFLAQLNLSELNAVHRLVPYNGMLYFFLQFGSHLSPQERCKVIYSSVDSNLHTLKIPEMYLPQNEFIPSRLKPYLAYYLPNFESKEVAQFNFKGDEIGKYFDLYHKISNYYGTEGIHRFMGYAYQVQGDLRHSWENDTYDLLFQLCCSEQNFKNRFSDAILYFGLDSKSVSEGKFENAVWVAQMT